MQQINTVITGQVQLSEDDQRKLINHVIDADKRGRDARAVYEENWKECWKAYHCIPNKVIDEEMEWQSNIRLPWAYDAVESWYAYMHGALFPKDDDVFTISGVHTDEHPGAEVLEKYLQYRFTKNKFPEQWGKALKQLAIFNHLCVKQYWKKDSKIQYDLQAVQVLDPTTQSYVTQNQFTPNVSTDYNNVWMDVVDLDNFSFYPIYGDFEKTTRIHTTYRFYEELMAAAQQGEAPYFNLDKIKLDDEKRLYGSDGTPNTPDRSTSIMGGDEKEKESAGLRIKEAWIHRVRIGDQVYRNYVATIVNDKWLIRFEPNAQPMGASPFIWMPLFPDGDCLYGYGLLSKGMPILRAAETKFNMRQDELNLKLYGSYKYWDDNVFNPYNVVSQPGAMILMASPESVNQNLQPLNPHLESVQLAYEEVQALQAEFEEVTVPKIVKGMVESDRDHSATEISATDNKASGKMNVQAFHINDRALQSQVEGQYALTVEHLHDKEVLLEIAKLTQDPTKTVIAQGPDGQPVMGPDGQPVQQQVTKTPEELIASLPQFLPVNEVDVKIVAYENYLRKQQTLQGIAAFLPQAYQSPMGQYIKSYEAGSLIVRLMGLPVDEVWASTDERKKIDAQAAQAHQQAQGMQQAAMQTQMQLEATKENNRHQEQMLSLQLNAQKLQLEAQKAAVDALQTDQQIKAKPVAKAE